MDTDLRQNFLDFLESNKRIIYKVCYMYATDEEHLKDLKQEVMINLWQGFRTYRGDAKPATWVYRVSLNTCISFHRKHGKLTGTLPLDSLLDMPAEDSEKTGRLKEMYALISRLDRMEKAIILMWLDERSYEEIAEITGIGRNTIASKLKRIKEKLTKSANR